ncbi:MAG: hypothetical protein KGI08_00220 [Thaumarchaeota archaeon]|nr:hypothetical protein [Nitrososphaerota archaeon]
MQPQSIRNIGVYGVIRSAEVNDSLIPDGAVTDSKNFHFDRKGAATVRPGLTAIGSTVHAGNAIMSVFNAQSSTLLVGVSAGGSVSIFMYNGSGWDRTLSGDTTNTITRFVDFAGRTIRVNGTYDSIKVWNGSNSAGWVSSGNPINPDQFTHDTSVNTQTLRAKYIEVYKSRIYLAGDPTMPDRLFYSQVISSAGNLAWTPSTDFVDINPSDGENISALKRYSLELLVFKPNYIYRFKTTGVDPDPLIRIGTRSQESVIEGKKGLYFMHDTGIFRYTGGYPEEISRPISDIISSISYANIQTASSWKDADHIYWNIGTLSVTERKKTTTYANAVIRYTESSDIWTLYSYPFNPGEGATYNNGSSITQAIGLDNGVVATFNSGTTDLGEPIKSWLVTKWYEYANTSSRLSQGASGLSFQVQNSIYRNKTIEEIVGICDKAQDTHIMYQVDDDDITWYDLGQMTDMISFFSNLNIKFNRIRFKIAVTSSLEAPIFQGLEITKGFVE